MRLEMPAVAEVRLVRALKKQGRGRGGATAVAVVPPQCGAAVDAQAADDEQSRRRWMKPR